MSIIFIPLILSTNNRFPWLTRKGGPWVGHLWMPWYSRPYYIEFVIYLCITSIHVTCLFVSLLSHFWLIHLFYLHLLYQPYVGLCQATRVQSHQRQSTSAVAIATCEVQVSAADYQTVPTVATGVSKPLCCRLTLTFYTDQCEPIVTYHSITLTGRYTAMQPTLLTSWLQQFMTHCYIIIVLVKTIKPNYNPYCIAFMLRIFPWWCHVMKTLSALLPTLWGERTSGFPHKRPVMRNFDFFLCQP